jgi:cell wall-associated NlpC family hydrolase
MCHCERFLRSNLIISRGTAIRLLSGLTQVGSLLVVVFLLVSCASTSPRFRSGEDPDAAEEVKKADAIRKEVVLEDDKKVDVQRVRTKYEKPVVGPVTDDTPSGLNRDKLLLDVVSYLGVPYKYGGTSRKGVDCSGFTSQIYASAVELALPRSTKEQFTVGTKITRNELKFGDLVFFNTTGRSPSHVGIFIEDDLFAHASVSEGVTFSSLESKYYKKRFVGARRVIH